MSSFITEWAHGHTETGTVYPIGLVYAYGRRGDRTSIGLGDYLAIPAIPVSPSEDAGVSYVEPENAFLVVW